MSSLLLSATDLRCERGGRALVDRFALTLHGGDCRWLRGANGSGKTTLLRTLAGLREPAAGRVDRHGPLRFLGHANGLKDDLSVRECLQLTARLQGAPLHGVEPALAALDLQRLAQRPTRTLSQGQKRRAALAALALPQPPGAVWLLDEPFDALDDTNVQRLTALLRALLAGGGALLFTSHQAVSGLPAQELQL